MKEESSYHLPLYNNCYFHVYNRAVGNDKLFFKAENYNYFLSRFKFYLANLIDVYAYCLMPNHFHFLIKINEEDPNILSKQFRRLFISYAMAINNQEKRKGNLFIKNFKRRLIEDERYLLSIVRYIHLNPFHHKLTKDYSNYKYSSYKTFLSNKPTIIKRKDVLDWFVNRARFEEFHEVGKEKIEEDFYNFEIE